MITGLNFVAYYITFVLKIVPRKLLKQVKNSIRRIKDAILTKLIKPKVRNYELGENTKRRKLPPGIPL